MGFLDKIKESAKDATGIGLSAQEQYARAYEKGVFLQPPDYSSAAKHFATASDKFNKEANQEMVQRARANAMLYQLISSRDCSDLAEVIQALEPVPEIEQIGSRDEMIPTAPLITELTAFQHEYRAETADESADKEAGYRDASNALMKLGASSLQIAEILQLSGPIDKAMLRVFYCGALADYFAALNVVMRSPAEAHDFLQKAATGFRQSKAKDWGETVDGYIEQVISKRYCWMCGREMQGKDIFYQYYPASTKEYHSSIIESLKQDSGMIDIADSVTLCTVCGSAIELQADQYATMRVEELKEWIEPILESHQEALENHDRRLDSLEDAAHTH